MSLARSSGLLLHISSLPSPGGIGDLGPAAYDFANFLHAAGQRVWQVLPINPVGYGNSPYGALSAMAGNPFFVSLEVLRDWGWLESSRLPGDTHAGSATAVDFDTVIATKLPLLREAAGNFLDRHSDEQWTRFGRYCHDKSAWLDDYAAFIVLRQQTSDALWTEWPQALMQRDPAALAEFTQQHTRELLVEKAIQFAFDEQWRHLHQYCRSRDIQLMGDVAIFVSYDSADVWTHPEMFELDEQRRPLRVAGVPPDYFSKSGQRWGNPLYRWDELAARGFPWWVARMQRAAELFDFIRLDHFRGFEAYWAIPAEDETAVHGKWVKAPGAQLFQKLEQELGPLPFIAEDLGIITPEVEALRTGFGLPGMRILQFGFGNRGAHSYLPHRYEPNTVVYTGTHDNDTTLGWWRNGATEAERHAIETYLRPGEDGPVWALIRAASTSVADLCLFPLQDVLGLGTEARMNVPSAAQGNWSWRFEQHSLTRELAEKLRILADVSDRTAEAEREAEEMRREDEKARENGVA